MQPGTVELIGVVHLPFGSAELMPARVTIEPSEGRHRAWRETRKDGSGSSRASVAVTLCDPLGLLSRAALAAFDVTSGGRERFIYVWLRASPRQDLDDPDYIAIEDVTIEACSTLVRAPEWSWSWEEDRAVDPAAFDKPAKKLTRAWITSIAWRTLVGLVLLSFVGMAESSGGPALFLGCLFLAWLGLSIHSWVRLEAQLRHAAVIRAVQ